jgi:hypothetical protein
MTAPACVRWRNGPPVADKLAENFDTRSFPKWQDGGDYPPGSIFNEACIHDGTFNQKARHSESSKEKGAACRSGFFAQRRHSGSDTTSTRKSRPARIVARVVACRRYSRSRSHTSIIRIRVKQLHDHCGSTKNAAQTRSWNISKPASCECFTTKRIPPLQNRQQESNYRRSVASQTAAYQMLRIL